jgi:sugar lactone lactonase YvrE
MATRLGAVLTAAAVGVLSGLALAGPADASVVAVISVVAGTGVNGAPIPGPATASTLSRMYGVEADSSGNFYIADSQNDVVEKVTAGGTLSVVAGTGTGAAPIPGPATSSPLNGPTDVAIDSAGNLYIADGNESCVLKVTSGGTLSVFVGTCGSGGAPANGPATSTQMNGPDGLYVDQHDNLYIADGSNSQIMKVTPAGALTIVAGSGSSGSPTPGPALSSDLYYPTDVVVDNAGNLYIADNDNDYIEKVTPAGILSIFAGDGSSTAPTPGPALSSSVDNPYGITIDPYGSIFVSVSGYNQIVKITPDGTLSVYAGTGAGAAVVPGPALSSPLRFPQHLAIGPAGLYVADRLNRTIDMIAPPTMAPTAPRVLTATRTGSTATLSFLPPVTDGGSPITGYEYSVDGGSTWHTLATSAAGAGRLEGIANGVVGATQFTVRAINAIGASAGNPTAAPAPVNAAPSLPVTGMQITLIVAVGILMALAGNGLRRAGRVRPRS